MKFLLYLVLLRRLLIQKLESREFLWNILCYFCGTDRVFVPANFGQTVLFISGVRFE